DARRARFEIFNMDGVGLDFAEIDRQLATLGRIVERAEPRRLLPPKGNNRGRPKSSPYPEAVTVAVNTLWELGARQYTWRDLTELVAIMTGNYNMATVETRTREYLSPENGGLCLSIPKALWPKRWGLFYRNR